MVTKDEWLELFKSKQADTRKDQMMAVLDNLDGYAIEYSIDQDADAEDLIAAFDAIQEWWAKKL